jgi:hypothetical protein
MPKWFDFGSIAVNSGTGVWINGVKYGAEKGTTARKIKIQIDGEIAEFDLSKNLNIEIKGNASDVQVNSGKVLIQGNAESVRTMSGSVGIEGDVMSNVKTMSGNIRTKNITGTAKTMSGNIITK